MNLIRWKSQPTFVDLFDNFFNKEFHALDHMHDYTPSVNVIEKKDAFELSLAVPGMKKEDFKISLDENLLTISSEKQEEVKEEEENYTRREFRYGSFSRSFTLPETIDESRIKAEYKEGILNLSLPKKEEEKKKISKEIKIS